MEMEINYSKFVPKAFHKYPSAVFNVIASSSSAYDADYVQTKMDLIRIFRAAGIPTYNDTKIVFEMQYGPSTIYLGFYEGEIQIGLGVMKED